MDVNQHRFLLVCMNECSEYKPDHNGECLNCDEWYSEHINLCTFEGFEKFYEWSKTQWWYEAILNRFPPSEVIEPDKFYDVVYNFLKDRQ